MPSHAPQQKTNFYIQQKSATKLETRPAPPVYNPQKSTAQPKMQAPPVYKPQIRQGMPPQMNAAPSAYQSGVMQRQIVQIRSTLPTRTAPNGPSTSSPKNVVTVQARTGTNSLPPKPSLPAHHPVKPIQPAQPKFPQPNAVLQARMGFEYEVGAIRTAKNTSFLKFWQGAWVPHQKGEVIMKRTGYDLTADIDQNTGRTNLEFVTHPIDENQPAEVTRLGQVARDIVADLQAIFNASAASTDPDNWVGADQIQRLNGWWWQRFRCLADNWNQMMGQLQMTGGVRLDRLPEVISGRAFGQQPTRAAALAAGPDAVTELGTVSRYYRTNPAHESKQPLWSQAWTAVRNRFSRYPHKSKELLASVIALMATTPIEKRIGGNFSADGSGLYLAKTDYAKTLQLVAEDFGDEIPETPFLRALIDTINGMLPVADHVNANSDVFPATYNIQGTTLTGVTLKQWVDSVLPIIDPLSDGDEFLAGYDLLTSKHFPGTAQQKKEMRAFGTFGNKADPGNKIILEWRSFQLVVPQDLERTMLSLADYLGRRVNG
jgi:hypothetical protein